MHLTLWTDYALRTLIYVGAKDGRLSTIAEIAESFGVSRTHLMKVVNQLGQQGYIETVRGKGGGIRLGRKPAEIVVGALVRDTEEDLAVMGCLADSGPRPGSAGSKVAASCAARCARRRRRFCGRSTATPWRICWRRARGSPAASVFPPRCGPRDEQDPPQARLRSALAG